MENKVQILMSTYNGDRYLEAQLESIFKQNYPNIELIVRDDGSSDRTIEILKKYKKQHNNMRVYLEDNIGVVQSFFRISSFADLSAEYFAFADQDDVWKPEKITKAVEILRTQKDDENNIPFLYCGNQTIVDEQLYPIETTVHSEVKQPAFGNALVQNICTGCTAVFNRAMLQAINYHTPEQAVLHDWWVYLIGACFGKVFYDQRSFIEYRQHSSNSSGGVMQNRFQLISYRVHQLFVRRGHIYRQNKEFLQVFGQWMEVSDSELMKILLDSEKSWAARCRIVKDQRVYRQKLYDNKILKLMILTGKL